MPRKSKFCDYTDIVSTLGASTALGSSSLSFAGLGDNFILAHKLLDHVPLSHVGTGESHPCQAGDQAHDLAGNFLLNADPPG
jgi:hypothetical protein